LFFPNQKRLFLSLIAWVPVSLSVPALSLASTENQGPDSLTGKEKLKVRFLKQMDDGNARLNLGLAYWIELNRQGHLYRTSNLAKFQSGDQIRFHVLPNTDGYAYIVMHKGTTGTKSVLFPPADSGINNFVKRGAECVVPRDGSLEFDQTPGTEQVGLLLSRGKIDPVAYLSVARSETKSSLPAPPKSPTLDQYVSANDPSDLEKSFDAIFSSGTRTSIGAPSSGACPGAGAGTDGGSGAGTGTGAGAGAGIVAAGGNPGALEVLASDHGVLLPEDPDRVLSSSSTALVVSDGPNAVVLVDFALKHD
jgi:hypothetical protein